jgi:uracil-DNA glycosylase
LSAANRLSRPLAAQVGDIRTDWRLLVEDFAATDAGRTLFAAVDERVRSGALVYPDRVFRALELTARAQTRVVILGQDPYHGAGQAEGLAFSVQAGQRLPPSLRNIFEECRRDLGLAMPASGSLLPWAQRGVLLLNTTLTVEDGQPGSHSALGWQTLTALIVQTLIDDQAPKVFLLWGAHAQALGARQGLALPHLVLRANHPSPLSARRPPMPFVGCGHFLAASRFLEASGRGPQDWALAD